METGKLLVPLHDTKKGWGVLFSVKFQVVSQFTKKPYFKFFLFYNGANGPKSQNEPYKTSIIH